MGHRELLLVLAIGMLTISALGGAWVGAGWVWDGANAAGFVAAALMIFLHVETGAVRTRPTPHVPFHARLHINLALLALGFVVVHAGALVADDTTTVEYWKVSAPPYMLAGIVALVLMGAIIATAYPRPRRVLFVTAARFRRIHGVASLVMCALVAWHVAGSALYLDTGLKKAAFVTALIVLPVWLIRRATSTRRPASASALADPPRPATEARRETLLIGAAGLSIAVVFSVLRNLPSLLR